MSFYPKLEKRSFSLQLRLNNLYKEFSEKNIEETNGSGALSSPRTSRIIWQEIKLTEYELKGALESEKRFPNIY